VAAVGDQDDESVSLELARLVDDDNSLAELQPPAAAAPDCAACKTDDDGEVCVDDDDAESFAAAVARWRQDQDLEVQSDVAESTATTPRRLKRVSAVEQAATSAGGRTQQVIVRNFDDLAVVPSDQEIVSPAVTQRSIALTVTISGQQKQQCERENGDRPPSPALNISMIQEMADAGLESVKSWLRDLVDSDSEEEAD
jgi:hypothetical protein